MLITLWDSGMLALFVALFLGATWSLLRLLRSTAATRWPLAAVLARRCYRPGLLTALLAGVQVGLPGQPSADLLPGPGLLLPGAAIRQTLALCLIAAVTWLAVQIAHGSIDLLLTQLAAAIDDSEAPRVRTQVMWLRRATVLVAVVLAFGAALLTFPKLRALGAGVLASAGLLGVVAGVAAQTTLGNVFAGVQIALNGALRVDDAVVVEGEWGRVEELTLTYVVVRTWDERRLILPVSYFTSKPFENWTRHAGELIGTVLLRVDWSVPVEKVRARLQETVREHPLWDGAVCVLQVTEVQTNGLVELRAMVSASSPSALWDLRCEVRERLVDFLRAEHPEALPRFRTETLPGPGPGTD